MPLPITLTVHNTTGRAVRGRIAVRGLADGWSDLATPPLTLLPDASMRTTLTVRPAAALKPGRYSLTVTMVAEDTRTVYATTTVDLRVMARPPLPRRAALWLAVISVILALLLLAGMWVFIGSGRSTARPTMAPTASTPVGRPTQSSRVIISRASAAPDVTATPTIRAAPTSPAAPVAPRIERFMVTHRRRDAPYAVAWQTSGATTVTMNGKTAAPSGQLALATPIKGATYRLVAIAGIRQVARQLHITVDSSGADRHAGSSILLSLPRIKAFALQSRGGMLYAAWQVSDATRVRLQGQPVYEFGMRIVPPGVTVVTLSVGNAVGDVQRTLPAPVAAPLSPPVPDPARTSAPLFASTPRPAATP